MKYKLYIFFLLGACLFACKHNTFSRVEYGLSFPSIARIAADGNKSFCIILSDPECPPCEVLHNSLYEDIGKSVGEKAIFNIVDISLPQNKWYQQFIASKGTPAALVFSSQSELIAVIHGAGRASLECIKSSLNDSTDCSRYLYRYSFAESIKNEDIIRSLNLILRAKVKLESRQDAASELEESMATLYYPYSLWLQIQNEKNKGNDRQAVLLAKQMLTFQKPLYATLYADFYMEARYTINPRFDIRDAPILEIEKDKIDLGKCEVGEEIAIKIKLKNKGKDTLLIHDVSVSCSCLKLLSESCYAIESGSENYLNLMFTADSPGEIKRNVILTTNEIEPVKSILILANAVK